MDERQPEPLRKGIVLRIENGGRPGERVIAFEFADLRFADRRVERWVGMGWPRYVPSVPEPMGELLDWAEQLAGELDGVLIDELRMEWPDVPGNIFAGLPSEIVVEWNATLPKEAFGDYA
jgi:hypothetical protein